MAEIKRDQLLGFNVDVDWRDRFYLEQRMGGWQAAKEQVYDLDGHHRMFPINSGRAFGLLVACDEIERREWRHQRRLISILDERLLTLPMNPPSSTFSPVSRMRHLWLVDRKATMPRVARAVVRGVRQAVGPRRRS